MALTGAAPHSGDLPPAPDRDAVTGETAAFETRPVPSSLRGHLPWLLLHLLLLSTLTVLAAPRISHDSANLLDFAQALVNGAVPYVDFVELNPPMSIYWHVPAALIARWTGLSLMHAFALEMGILAGISLGELLLLFRRLRPPLSPFQLGGVGIIWIGASFWVLLHGGFGQREHLYVLMYVPFLICRWLRYCGVRVPMWLAAFIGVQAALGVSIKPGFVATAVLVEFTFMLIRRTWRELGRTEVVTFVMTGLAYALHWFYVPAAMRDAFFHHLLPLIVHGYAAYNQPFGLILNDLLYDVADRIELFGSVFVMLLAGGLALRRDVELRLLLAGLSVAAAVSLAAFFQQHKGWSYQLDPFRFFTFLILATFIAQAFRARNAVPLLSGWRRYVLAGVVILALAAICPLLADKRLPRPSSSPLRKIIEAHTQRGDPILILSTNTADIYPVLISTERRRATRFGIIFPLALIYHSPRAGTPPDPYHIGSAITPEEQRFLDQLSHDMRQTPPRLIAIARGTSQGLPRDFRILDYLKQNGFISREIDPNFDDTGAVANFEIYVPKVH